VIGTDRWRSEPPCVYPPAQAGHMAKQRVGVEYSPSMLEPVRPGAVSPDRALYLPTFSHSVVVNKTERERERERESKKARDRERERGESPLSLPSLPFFLSFSLRVPLLPYPSPFSLSLLSLSLSLYLSLILRVPRRWRRFCQRRFRGCLWRPRRKQG